MSTTVYLEDVKEVAEKQMHNNGMTTTLDVKLALWADGHEVNQSQVSAFMRQLAKDNGYEGFFNGMYIHYSLPKEEVLEEECIII
jgi:hypothetical protein